MFTPLEVPVLAEWAPGVLLSNGVKITLSEADVKTFALTVFANERLKGSAIALCFAFSP